MTRLALLLALLVSLALLVICAPALAEPDPSWGSGPDAAWGQ